MKNSIIRAEAKNKGVYLWEIADRLGMSPNYFSVVLRHQLSDKETNMILSLIEQIHEFKMSEGDNNES